MGSRIQGTEGKTAREPRACLEQARLPESRTSQRQPEFQGPVLQTARPLIKWGLCRPNRLPDLSNFLWATKPQPPNTNQAKDNDSYPASFSSSCVEQFTQWHGVCQLPNTDLQLLKINVKVSRIPSYVMYFHVFSRAGSPPIHTQNNSLY